MKRLSDLDYLKLNKWQAFWYKFGLFFCAIPLFFKNMGITDEGECGIYVSLFAFFSSLAYAIFLPIWGTLSDRYGVKIMLLRGTFGTAFIFPIMGYVSNPWLLIGLRFLTAA